jgi:hypothetical protein
MDAKGERAELEEAVAVAKSNGDEFVVGPKPEDDTPDCLR